MNLVSLPRNSFNLQNSLSLNYKGVHSTSPVLPPFFYVLCSFCLSSCSQTKEKLGNTQTCFKNTYVLDQPQTSWSNWSQALPRNCYFSKFPGWWSQCPARVRSHWSSFLQRESSRFSLSPRAEAHDEVQELEVRKLKVQVSTARNSIRENATRKASRYLFVIPVTAFLLSSAPGALSFFPYLCHLLPWTVALTQAFISWSIVWISSGNLILAASWVKGPAFIMMLSFLQAIWKTDVYVLRSSWCARLNTLYRVRPGSWLTVFHLLSMWPRMSYVKQGWWHFIYDTTVWQR